MKRIATPMIGGVVTSTVMELAVYPAIFSCRAQALEIFASRCIRLRNQEEREEHG
jgi:hypothetical protein